MKFGISWGSAALTAAGFASATILLAGPARAGSEDSEDRRVRIINETRHTMVHFYASNVSENSWQEDILGRSVLRPGEDVMVNVDDGTGHCEYDFKAVFDNGKSLIRYRVNVCKIESYRYSE
ncbi:MAG: hypothetical protein JO127_09855 [Caulobacteraceae bacterium]|nr:hypothetical protein [Caulobacteraceae bacterium]